MSCKSFNICVILDILDVTCPGVCICPKGMVCLDIRLFGCNSSTSYVEPKFPLVFNEKFSFHENFAELSNLKDVQKCLEEKCVHMALVQVYKNKQVTLATYNSNVNEVLYPERNRLSRNGKLSILMKNKPFFPGTISPKITLITKTSITEQINVVSRDDHSSSQCSKTQDRPNRMKKVHHSKSRSAGKKELRISPCKSRSSDSESDTDSQLYCYRTKKTNNVMNSDDHLEQSCKHCQNTNRMKNTRCGQESSLHKNSSASESHYKSTNKDECKEHQNKFSKNIKASLNVGAHHHKCCESKLDKSSCTNESINKSNEDLIREDKLSTSRYYHEDGNPEEEPRKMNPKIRAQLHLAVYRCRCGSPDCDLNTRWKNMRNENSRKDTIEDTIRYNICLKNYYSRLYNGATYQLARHLKLL